MLAYLIMHHLSLNCFHEINIRKFCIPIVLFLLYNEVWNLHMLQRRRKTDARQKSTFFFGTPSPGCGKVLSTQELCCIESENSLIGFSNSEKEFNYTANTPGQT